MQRLEDESYEDYRVRRKATQIFNKIKTKGKWFYTSNKDIPYVRKEVDETAIKETRETIERIAKEKLKQMDK